ncbi:MAG: phosphatidylserine decarboxylase [Elusimicrobia bacterium]|jgi:phosphatidylserine decarboxylase|nr:phosphatidylserine decarboxylase [Elusimicrobiota bacterium]
MNDPSRFIPIAGDGWKFVLAFAILGGLFSALGPWFSRSVGVILLLLAVFSLYFFRDGKRSIPVTTDILSPADGRVLEVADIDGEGYGQGRVVRIFLSVLDGHVQRAPVAGQVTRTEYRAGSFLDARNPRAPFVNEANSIEFNTPQGKVMIRQIAGFIARRILCWVRPEDNVVLGERVGLIRFGSQVDLYVPPGVEILVKEGQRVRAGETVMARWGKS